MPRPGYPGTIDRRGDTFRVRLRVGGVRHSFTVRTDARDVAERFAMAKYVELTAPAPARVRRRVLPDATMSLVLELFRNNVAPRLAVGTRESYEDSFKAIARYFVDIGGDPAITGIDGATVTHFLAWRAGHRLKGEAPLHNRTIAKDRAVLHRLFRYAVQIGLCTANPVTLIDAPKSDERDPVILSAAQYQALVAACAGRPMLELYVIALGETGLRCESECLWLRWEDVNLQEGFLWIASGRLGHRTKSGKGRWVPMTSMLIEAMRRHFARFRFATYDGHATPWVFHHERTRRRARAGERIRSLRESFRNAAQRAQLPANLRQHDMRHRRVTTWLAEEKNPVHVKEAMGHSDLRVTMEYQHLSREHLRSLVDARPASRRRGARG